MTLGCVSMNGWPSKATRSRSNPRAKCTIRHETTTGMYQCNRVYETVSEHPFTSTMSKRWAKLRAPNYRTPSHGHSPPEYYSRHRGEKIAVNNVQAREEITVPITLQSTALREGALIGYCIHGYADNYIIRYGSGTLHEVKPIWCRILLLHWDTRRVCWRSTRYCLLDPRATSSMPFAGFWQSDWKQACPQGVHAIQVTLAVQS